MDGERVVLRVEGQNLDRFVFGTEDLSTIRGGGLLLLDVARLLERGDRTDARRPLRAVFEEAPVKPLLASPPKPISVGASIALFEARLAKGAAPDVLRKAIETALGCHRVLKYATLAVDVLPLPDGADFSMTRERAILANRRRQLRAPTVVAALADEEPDPDRDERPLSDKEKRNAPHCDIDRVSRAVVAQPMKGSRDGLPIGAATRARRGYGADAKRRQFYEQYSGRAPVPRYYSWDLQQVAGDAPREVGQLDRKIAVIYIDGNKFTDKQQQALRRAGRSGALDAQRKFDEQVQARRKEVMAALIDDMMAAAPAVWGGPDERRERPPCAIEPWFHWVERHFDRDDGRRGGYGWGAVSRFETLMWGGDEMMWVVPAWKGWEVLTRFYDPNWQIRALGDEPLTHAAGLVFCHYNAPLRRIKNLAQELVALCKARNDKEERDRVAYQVLESFDLVSGDIAQHRDAFLQKIDVEPTSLLLSAAGLREIEENIRFLKERGLPTRQLHRVAEYIRNGKQVPEPKITGDEAAVTALERLLQQFGGGNTGWWQLLELWEYIAPEAEMTGEPLRMELPPYRKEAA